MQRSCDRVSLSRCDSLQVLLVSTSRDPELWIIPGGGIEPTEEVQMAALREVLEEAGVKGQLDRCLGVFEVCFTWFLGGGATYLVSW